MLDPTFIGEPIDDTTFSFVCALDGARTERLEYNAAFEHLEKACACHSVQITQIENLTQEVFATRVTSFGTDWRAGLDALITQILQSQSPELVESATKSFERKLLSRSKSIECFSKNGQKETEKDSGHTKKNGLKTSQIIEQRKQLSKSSENTECQKDSAIWWLLKVGSVLSALKSQKDYASTTAMTQESTGDSCASSAILQSVYWEIIQKVWSAHSSTCESRKSRLDGQSLLVDYPEDDPLHDPSCWKKANPMLGVTITEEWLGAQVKRAKQLPSDLNEVLRLNFCVWTDAESAWMSRDVIEPLLADFDPAEHHGKRISIGMDLSQSRDITATGNVVKTGDVEVWVKDKAGRDVKTSKPTFDIWVEAWTPGDTMQAREERDKLPYTVWAKQGHIHAPKGENISYLHVAQTLVEYSQDYDVAMVAYDRYAFRRFEEDADTVGLAVNFVEHPQGGTKKGKPTEEMEAAAKQSGRASEGLWFPSSLRMLEDAMLEGRVRFKRNPVLISAIMSAVVEQDKWDNKWLSKQRSVNKIDAIVAVVMAFGAANAMQTEKKKLQLFMVG